MTRMQLRQLADSLLERAQTPDDIDDDHHHHDGDIDEDDEDEDDENATKATG